MKIVVAVVLGLGILYCCAGCGFTVGGPMILQEIFLEELVDEGFALSPADLKMTVVPSGGTPLDLSLFLSSGGVRLVQDEVRPEASYSLSEGRDTVSVEVSGAEGFMCFWGIYNNQCGAEFAGEAEGAVVEVVLERVGECDVALWVVDPEKRCLWGFRSVRLFRGE